MGASWTWSHTLGNFNGETAGSGAVRGLPDFYPEYTQASWGLPRGDLATDQRHRVRAFATWDIPLPKAFGVLSLGVIQALRHAGRPTAPRLGDRLAVRDEPGLRDAAAREHVLLHVARRVPDGHRLAHGPRAELRLPDRGRRRDLRPPAGHQRLQQPGRDRRGHDGRSRRRTRRGFTRFNPFTTQPVQGERTGTTGRTSARRATRPTTSSRGRSASPWGCASRRGPERAPRGTRSPAPPPSTTAASPRAATKPGVAAALRHEERDGGGGRRRARRRRTPAARTGRRATRGRASATVIATRTRSELERA